MATIKIIKIVQQTTRKKSWLVIFLHCPSCHPLMFSFFWQIYTVFCLHVNLFYWVYVFFKNITFGGFTTSNLPTHQRGAAKKTSTWLFTSVILHSLTHSPHNHHLSICRTTERHTEYIYRYIDGQWTLQSDEQWIIIFFFFFFGTVRNILLWKSN